MFKEKLHDGFPRASSIYIEYTFVNKNICQEKKYLTKNIWCFRDIVSINNTIKFSSKFNRNSAYVNLVQANPSYTHGDVSHAARRNMTVRSSMRLMGIYSGKLLVAITEYRFG